MHEGYNFSYDVVKYEFEMKNDIGLIKIDPSTIKLKDKLMPICLPDANVTLTKECWITGFGSDNNSNSEVEQLTKFFDFLRLLEDHILS